MDNTDKLKDIDYTMDETTTDYYSDIYSPWETKEQLKVWDEVEQSIYKTWEFDTADATITKTSNVYNFYIPNPDGKIISLELAAWWDTDVHTFGIGFFWSSSTAYLTLESEMQDWLWVEYIVTYLSAWNFSVERADKTEFGLSDVNRARVINIDDTSILSDTTITIDGVDFVLSWNANNLAARTDFESQLTANWNYYFFSASNAVSIARKDSEFMTISVVTTPNYTYSIDWRNRRAWLDSSRNVRNSDIFWTGWSAEVFVKSNELKLNGVQYKVDNPVTTTSYTYSEDFTDPWVTKSFAGYGQWGIQWAILVDEIYKNLWASYTVTNFAVSTNDTTANDLATISFNKNDYSQVVLDDTVNITWRYNDSALTQDGRHFQLLTWATGGQELQYIFTEDSNEQTITNTAYTAISSTLTRTWFSYFIPTQWYPKLIEIKAVSSWWSSEWKWEKREQSCTAAYWSTTEIVSDKIFKTDAGNFWQLTKIKRWWIEITRTTNKSNKITWACTS